MTHFVTEVKAIAVGSYYQLNGERCMLITKMIQTDDASLTHSLTPPFTHTHTHARTHARTHISQNLNIILCDETQTIRESRVKRRNETENKATCGYNVITFTTL